MTPERASELCLSCGLCCKVVLAYFPIRRDVAAMARSVEWRQIRGIKRAPFRDLPGLEAWLIPSVCPALDPATNKCGVYETRPELCRTFDGRTAMEIDCKWREEPDEV